MTGNEPDSTGAPNPDSLIPLFKYGKVLKQDQGGRRLALKGSIEGKDALLLAERAAFSTDEGQLRSFALSLDSISNLGDNDIYRWYMARSSSPPAPSAATPVPDVKLTLIYPCTASHVRKYTFQQFRVVTETPHCYMTYIRPYMAACREQGRLNWVFNILDGRTEQEDVLYRSAAADPRDDYLLLPDLNWDRATLSTLHLLALVARRDLWSVRDLTRADARWLRLLRATLAARTAALYPGVEEDMLKFYLHYQPTYYHFHVHVVHVDCAASETQAVGKALGLDGVIALLEGLRGEEAGMADVELTYTIGEASELWTDVFGPLKEGREPHVGG